MQEEREKERRMQMNEVEMAAVNAGVQPETVAVEGSAGTAAEGQAAADVASAAGTVGQAMVSDTGVTGLFGSAGTAETVAGAGGSAGVPAASTDGAGGTAGADASVSVGTGMGANASVSTGTGTEAGSDSGLNSEPVFSDKVIEDGLRGIKPERGKSNISAVDSVFDKLPAEGSSDGQNKAAEASASVGSKDVSPAGNAAQDGDSVGNKAVQEGTAADVRGAADAEVSGVTETSVTGTTGDSNGNGKPADSAVPNQTVARPVRDYEAEWKELAEAHPEVVGTTLPEDIFQACIKSDQPPLRVYESMMLQRMRDEVERLKQENDRLRQNETNAQRAPVTGTLAGGATDTKEEDPFIAGFNRYR